MANRREYAIPSRYRNQSGSGPVLDLGNLVFRFAPLPAPIDSPAADPAAPVEVAA
jgi:hypothetical protein